MDPLPGEVWWKPALANVPAATSAGNGGPGLVLDDRLLAEPGGPGDRLPPDLRRLIVDRGALREHLAGQGLPTPRWARARTFEEASRQVIAGNRFPLAIKSARNGMEGQGVFRLEAFRELPKFIERLHGAAPDADLIIEDWIQVQATVEVTVGAAGNRLYAQKSLEKSLAATTAWRLFPVKPPPELIRGTDRILAALPGLGTAPGSLCRLTIGLAGKDCFLLALSGAANRLEYFPGWCEKAGVMPTVGEAAAPPATTVQGPGPTRWGRLQFLRRPSRQPPFPSALPPGCPAAVTRYFAAGRQAVALLSGPDPKALMQQATLLVRLLEEAGES
ncbi:MAG: ATP-grasp domain-containing protein [Candidatus Riflebacteria bacterium]|nr:ATP-grasp domain-containing protein [Candidatus Riflebacteria bacterium]